MKFYYQVAFVVITAINHCLLVNCECLEGEGAPLPFRIMVRPLTISCLLPSKKHFSEDAQEKLQHIFHQHQVAIWHYPPNDPVVFRFQLNAVYLEDLGVADVVKRIFCSRAAEGVNAIFLLSDIQDIDGEANNQIAKMIHTLANNAGMPTLAWSSSTSELCGLTPYRNPNFIFSPSIRSYAKAVMAYLDVYPRSRFSIIASVDAAGHDIFIRFLLAFQFERQNRKLEEDGSRYFLEKHRIQVTVMLTDWRRTLRTDLQRIRSSASKHHIVIVYVEEDLGDEIFREAVALGMASLQYTWLCTRPVLGSNNLGSRLSYLIPGSIAATYEISVASQVGALKAGTELWMRTLHTFLKSPNVTLENSSPQNICSEEVLKPWIHSDFFNGLLDRSHSASLKEGLLDERVLFLEYTDEGKWIEIGQWNNSKGLVLRSREQDEKQKQKKAFRIATLPESPFVMYRDPPVEGGNCPTGSIPCRLSILHPSIDNATRNDPNYNGTYTCATGLFIDLLLRLSTDMEFTVDLFEVHDRKWGSIDKPGDEWNGLVKALMVNDADLVVTSLKITKERSEVIDFTTPILETGITMLVSVQDEVASSTAFLEPFSFNAWIGICALAVTSAIVIYCFEFLVFSHSEFYILGKKDKSLSFFASVWYVMAMLLKASVPAELPRRSVAAKLMSVVWATFCVIFVSSYTANLAVFMITKEHFHEFSGLDDMRILSPKSGKPWRLATLTAGATETYLRFNFPPIYELTRPHRQTSLDAAVKAIKEGDLDAFIYDAAALDFRAKRDKACRLRLTGKVHAATGYGIGFPMGSLWRRDFDKLIIEYRSQGFLENLRQFWMSGQCQTISEESKSSRLGLRNMQSVVFFLLIGCGFAFLLLPCRKSFPRNQKPSSKLLKKMKHLLSVGVLLPIGGGRRCITVDGAVVEPVLCDNCRGFGHRVTECTSPAMQIVG